MKRFFKLHHWLLAMLIGIYSISAVAVTSPDEQLCMDRVNKICGKFAYYGDYAKCIEQLHEHDAFFPCKNRSFIAKSPPSIRVQFSDPMPFLSQHCERALNDACANKRYLGTWRAYLKCVSSNIVLPNKCFQRQVSSCEPGIIITMYK